MGKTPIISCEIAGEKTSMVLDMGSEVTILQEWWFNEYLMASVDCLDDASSWLRLEAANSLVFPYIGYFTGDINVIYYRSEQRDSSAERSTRAKSPQENLGDTGYECFGCNPRN